MNAARFRLRAALVAVLSCCAAVTAPARAETDVGALAALLYGTHVGENNPQPVSGLAAGALLEASQIWPRVRIHLEGFPQIGVSASGTGEFGHSSATLSLLNAEALVGIDRNSLVRVGGGFQLVNLSNHNGNNGDTNQSRVTTPLFTVQGVVPLVRHQRVELTLRVGPNVNGILHVFNYLDQAKPAEPERGAEVDYSAVYGWQRGITTYLVGFRGLSYHTRNINNGQLVDSIVGGGVTVEARFAFGRK